MRNHRQVPRGTGGRIVRALLSLVALAKGECQRASMAMQMKMLPPGMGGERETWQGEDETTNAVTDGFDTFDVGLFGAVASQGMNHLQRFDTDDREQLSEIRYLLMIGQELCRERLGKQVNRKSASSRSWLFFGNQFAAALRQIAEIDRTLPDEDDLGDDETLQSRDSLDLGRFERRIRRPHGDA